MKYNFTLGCDPEMFLVDEDGSLVSSIGRIGGSKRNPRPLGIGDGYAVQEDNVAVEYNIPPAKSAEEFSANIDKAINAIYEEVRPHGLAFSHLSAASFPLKELAHPAAMEFGCDPDFNAWEDGSQNPRPRADDDTLRSCGGHVHIGYKFKSKKDVINFIKVVDLTAGVPSVLMDNGEKRKILYGKAGAFRYKPFGAEYRTLSNYWTFVPQYREWVWNTINRAMELVDNKIDIDSEKEAILSAINNNNKDVATSLINKYSLAMA